VARGVTTAEEVVRAVPAESLGLDDCPPRAAVVRPPGHGTGPGHWRKASETPERFNFSPIPTASVL
jgi:hypothetical protein